MAPGSPLVPPDEQLVALWRNRGGQRFQNYRATFTVLDANPLKRTWLDSVLLGAPLAAWGTTGQLGQQNAMRNPSRTAVTAAANARAWRPSAGPATRNLEPARAASG